MNKDGKRWDITQGKGGRWWWHVYKPNGKTWSSSTNSWLTQAEARVDLNTYLAYVHRGKAELMARVEAAAVKQPFWRQMFKPLNRGR